MDAQRSKVCPLGQEEIGIIFGRENRGGLVSRRKAYLAQEFS